MNDAAVLGIVLAVLISLLGSSVVAAAVAGFISQRIQRDKYTLDQEQERFRNHYNRQVAVVFELYPQAVEVYRAAYELLLPAKITGASEEVQQERLLVASNAFRDNAWRTRLLFPPAVVKELDEFVRCVDRATIKFVSSRSEELRGFPERNQLEAQGFEIVSTELSKHLETLEKAFRGLLGSNT